jgi:hypothetical protein
MTESGLRISNEKGGGTGGDGLGESNERQPIQRERR